MRDITTIEVDRKTHERLREMAERTGLRIGRLAVLILRKGLDDFPKVYPELTAAVDRIEPVQGHTELSTAARIEQYAKTSREFLKGLPDV